MNQNNYPNLYIPGAAKSGTSTLHDLLNFHPNICMSSEKEPHYWVAPNFDSKNLEDKKHYLDLFARKEKCYIKGESSTSYMVLPEFIERIKASKPQDLKFIFILRNPIDRLYSHYWYLKGLGDEYLDLKSAIQADYDMLPTKNSRHKNGKYKHYFQFGRYGHWLDSFYKNFESHQIKIILFEDLISDQLKVANECFDFLNLKRLQELPNVETNKTTLLKFPKTYRLLQDINNGRLSILKPLNPLIPTKVKRILRSNVNSYLLQKTTLKKYPQLTATDRAYIKSLYITDVEKLKTITKLNFDLWDDFKA